MNCRTYIQACCIGKLARVQVCECIEENVKCITYRQICKVVQRWLARLQRCKGDNENRYHYCVGAKVRERGYKLLQSLQPHAIARYCKLTLLQPHAIACLVYATLQRCTDVGCNGMAYPYPGGGRAKSDMVAKVREGSVLL